MKSTCEMKGFLNFLILKMISKQPMSGECIRIELEKRKGCKPSPGTIYPVLKSLQEDGLIQEKEDNGKTKYYALTELGKKELKVATKKFVNLFYDMKEDFQKI